MARDTRETRQRLLDAARTEFAEHGLEGARVDRIAKAAGVSKERIYGHFGNKEQLFEAVLSAALAEAAELKPGADLTDPAAYAAATFDFHRANPQLIRLMMWESLQRQRLTPEAAAQRARFYTEEAQRLGAPGLDNENARFILYGILALATWVQALPIASSMVFGGAPDPEDLRERIEKAVTALAEPR
ncbi:transcriptional regulator, TetR family [Actinacidiphila alni]|uniref:Transcriptional regulator, TetR family n=1 Tax=Actinacidiphila alni TaxID=380248 RepID=A0A1I2LD43_9ACTN|nr:TetR family transcriptional regulator [Actinacidiphila alni]SFF75407.1 transcriptional regulator, TetR family [Actinacidiphila alni]